MSGILGIFNLAGGPVDVAQSSRMVERQSWRGGPSTGSAKGPSAIPSAIVSASRYDWEFTNDHSGDVLVLDDPRYLVAADASIFYRKELRARLSAQGIDVVGDTASHYILAAYKAWGADCAAWLEGVFAFVVYDRETGGVFCARDHAGMRPLFCARFGDTLIISSTIAAILAYRDCLGTLNLSAIAVAAAGWLVCCGADTCFEEIQVVLPGKSMAWDRGRERCWRHWDPPPLDAAGCAGFHEAAEELRELLARAVFERLSHEGTTAVWMSGGRDSTAVFAAGRHALSREPGGRRLHPISVSYPEGDLGREDDLIEAVAGRWNSEIHWLHIDGIPMFDGDVERAASRDEPSTSPYENWNLALARGARSCDASVALDGNGGDQLFRVTDIYLSDLLRSGRLIELAREWKAKRSRGRRHLFEMTFRPSMTDGMLAAFNRWQGRQEDAVHYLQFPRPSWLRKDFIDNHDLVGRQLASLPDRRERNQEAALMRWYMMSPMPGYAHSVLQQRLLPVGIDLRSPLLDRRIVEFAFRRPRPERLTGLDDKRLLRESMRGLIPDHVLAQRPTRTGITISYSRRCMKTALPALFEKLLQAPMQLAELGIIETAQLHQEVAAYRQGRASDFARIALFHTLQAELWLRAQTIEHKFSRTVKETIN